MHAHTRLHGGMRHLRRRPVRRATVKLAHNGAYTSLAAPLCRRCSMTSQRRRRLHQWKSTHVACTQAHTECPRRGASQSPLLLLRTLSMKAAACLIMMWVRSSRTQMMMIRTRRPMAGGTRCRAGARAMDPWWQGDVVLRGADPAW